MDELQKVKLFPIPKIDLHTEDGRKKLEEIKAKGPAWPHFDLEVSQETAKRGIYSVYHFNIEFSPPPFPESNLRINKFQRLEEIDELESGTLIVWAYPI